MGFKDFLVFSLVGLIPFFANAQRIVTGTVVGIDGKSAIPFVNIGIKGKNVGAVSLNNGAFSIIIPTQNENDTLTFSTVGYEELNIPLNKMTNDKTLMLKEKVITLEPVSIVASRVVEHKFGIRSKGNIHLIDASMNQNDIFEIAQVIRLGNTRSRITSVNLLINEARKDSGIFRINFYALEQNKPGRRIVEKSIVQVKEIKEGWLRFDLAEYNVYLDGNFVAGIEFIPTGKKSAPITYEAKLGGSARSFVRKNSQGDWEVPFHHYRLFVTALVPETENTLQVESEEKESVADMILFSKSVNDTFRIFIGLPKGYRDKRKKYPVVYLLDANVYFDVLANLMLANKTDAILVGIGYRDFLQMDSLRDRDYSYPDALPQDSFKISGGGKRFLSFISDELIPFIDKSYRTDADNRTLMGHSLGGYFTLFALEQAVVNRKNTFRNYVAPSPELKYHDSWVVKQFENFTGNDDLEQLNLFLTFGKMEDAEDGGSGTVLFDNFNLFTDLMHEKKFRNIRVNSIVYPGFHHMETAIPTFNRVVKEMK